MFYRGTDWNLGELEDINWDVLGRSDDHIVPHQGVCFSGEPTDPRFSQKKPRHEVKNDAGKVSWCRDPGTKTVILRENACYPPMETGTSSLLDSNFRTSNIAVPTLCNLKSTTGRTPSTSQDGIHLYSSITEMNGSSSNVKSSIYCQKNPSQGPTLSTNADKSCLSSLNGVSTVGSDFSLLEGQQKDREHDLAYYDWPDIDNFEDVDKMFRNWDSTFGHEKSGTADELSWFSSSSNTFHGLGIAYEPGCQNSNSVLCTDANFLSQDGTAKADHDNPTSSSSADWSCDGGNAMKHLGVSQISNEYSLSQRGKVDIQVRNQPSSGDERKQSTDEMLLESNVAASQIYYPQQNTPQEHLTGFYPSSYMHNLDPKSQFEFSLPTNGVSLSQINDMSDQIVSHPIQCLERFPGQSYLSGIMSSEQNIENLHQMQQSGTLIAELPQLHSAFRSKFSVLKTLPNFGDDVEMEDASLELPAVEMQDPAAQESSDDMSEKLTSFQQLQGVMHQLDSRTKMCIRDSLYRLARSARQRHASEQNCHDVIMEKNCHDVIMEKNGIQLSRASKSSGEFMVSETNTNPIDRSIAHLLFHKPPAIATRSVNDTGSAESQIKHSHVPDSITANHVLVPDQFDMT